MNKRSPSLIKSSHQDHHNSQEQQDIDEGEEAPRPPLSTLAQTTTKPRSRGRTKTGGTVNLSPARTSSGTVKDSGISAAELSSSGGSSCDGGRGGPGREAGQSSLGGAPNDSNETKQNSSENNDDTKERVRPEAATASIINQQPQRGHRPELEQEDFSYENSAK